MKSLSPLEAIRTECLACCYGNKKDVKLCKFNECNLYVFRLGRNPYLKRDLTAEQRRAIGDRLRLARTKKATAQTVARQERESN